MDTPQKYKNAKSKLELPDVPDGKIVARLEQLQRERGLGDLDGEALESADFAMAVPGGAPLPVTSPYVAAFEMMVDSERTAAPIAPVPVGWRPLGPYSIPHGQTYGSGLGSRPSVSGRISALAVDPQNENHVLIGAGGGGIWETHDAGQTWEPRADDQPSLAIGALAFDPSNPAIVYAGTGEGNALWWLGAGVLRSTDGGTSWSPLPDSQFEGTGFYDLVVDPLDGDHLLGATRLGLYESTDGGMVWIRRRNARTWSLSMHPVMPGVPDSTQEVLAACSDGLFRSTDGGNSWSSVNLPGGPGLWTQRGNRLKVRHAPSNGSIVYIFGAGASANTAHLWRRETFGGDFQSFQPPSNLRTGQAFYDWFAGVAPNNPDVLYIGAIHVHRGIRSPGGNWSWSNLSQRFLLGDSIHPDQHAIAFSPINPDIIYVGNDGGIYRSPDGGTRWESLNKGLGITEFEYLAQHPEHEAYLLAGTQDNGTMRHEGEVAWFHVQDGDGGDCAVNAASPEICYHTFYGMGMQRSKRGGERGSWDDLVFSVPNNENYPGGAQFYPPVEARNDIIAQASRSLYVSRSNGDDDTWERIPLPAGSGIASALAIPTETEVYVGTDAGNIYRIEFEQGSWQSPVALTQPASGYLSDILVDPTNPDRIWVTYSSGASGQRVFRREDDGSWTNASTGLPVDIAANAIEIDPDNTDTLWVAMDVGVWQTVNGGNSWESYSHLLPNALVKDLLLHQPSRLLRAATQSRGVWEIAVDSTEIPAVELYLRDSSVDTGRLSPSPSGIKDPFHPGSRTHWYQCKDIKIDTPPFKTPSIAELDFEQFEDDRGPFAIGLLHENIQPNQASRIYVQVHNRGPEAATDVIVKLFHTPAAIGLPDLPASFWENFPDNTLPADSPWQPVASHAIIPRVRSVQGEIVGFEWEPPSQVGTNVSLLAIVSSAEDPITTQELNVAALVQNHKKCGLKSLATVNPPVVEGSQISALHLNLWGSGQAETYSLEADRGSRGMIRGIVFSKHLSELARAAQLPEVALGDEEKAQLDWLLRQNPALEERLDLSVAYRAPRRGTWLPSFSLNTQTPEQVVVLIEPKPHRGHWTLSQRTEEGVEVGGFTLLSSRVE